MNILATYNSLDFAAYNMLGELSLRDGINVYIAVASDRDAAKAEGKCIPLRIPPVKSKYSRPAIKELRKIIKEYDIDITYSISTSALSNVIFACRGNRKVKILGYSGTDTSINRLDLTYYLGWLNPRVNHIVCVTPHIKEILKQYVKADKLTVIQKPYDIAWVEDACRNPKEVEGVPAGAFKIVNVSSSKGRPTKGLKYLVEAIEILNDPAIHLILIGDYDDSVYKQAQKTSVRNNIHFLGRREDATYLLPKQDVFVSSSLRDAWPRVVREAMACGLPCIVTDIPGPRDMVVDGETGLIVKPASGQAIADAIRWMKGHEAERKEFGRNGRQRIIDVYPTGKYVDAYEKLFRQLAGK